MVSSYQRGWRQATSIVANGSGLRTSTFGILSFEDVIGRFVRLKVANGMGIQEILFFIVY